MWNRHAQFKSIHSGHPSNVKQLCFSLTVKKYLYNFLSKKGTITEWWDLGSDTKGSKEICEHFVGIDENKVSPRALECEECEKEDTDWVALRMCLICGHVGCCDSSEGLHATRHFKQTGHPVMIALPNKPWKWCYLHKEYY